MGSLKKIRFLWLVLLHMQCFAVGNDTMLQVQTNSVIPGDFSDFYADNLGNIYVITKTNQVKKINSNGDSLAVFNDVRRYGNIWLLDVTNPLKILVYYKDFSTVLVLDRFLTIRNTIDLRTADILQVKALTQSYDNNYWLYDELDARLKKVDDNGNVLFASTDFRLLFTDAVSPEKIIDNNGQLYLYDHRTGWYLFDYYGAFKKKLPYTNWKDVQVTDNRLSGRDNQLLYFCNSTLPDFSSAKININLQEVIKLQQQMNKFIALTKQGLTIYTKP